MGTVKQMLERLEVYEGRVSELAEEAFNQSSEAAADLNASQLAQGMKTDGSKTDYPYTPLTIALKRGKPGLSGVTSYLTNYDTGESYRKLYATADGGRIEWGTQTDKEDAIDERMDGMAFGLTSENMATLQGEHLLPNYKVAVKNILKIA
ncbi:MAG: hypothetical protein ACRC1V_11830 [Plesiomonas sp.]